MHYRIRSSRQKAFMVLRWAALGMTVATGASGCSQNTAEEYGPRISASKICDRTLDENGISALRRLGGTDDFNESTGITDTGESKKFSMPRAMAHLHDDNAQLSTCTVYTADNKSGAPLVQLDFSASESYPSRSVAEDEDPRGLLIFYPIGVYASTKADNSTSLYFRCTTKGAKGSTAYIRAGVFSVGNQLKGNSTSKDRMTILNSVSRRLAAEAGCADEARLPAKVPAPEVPGAR
ncbi:hypothetical protein [Streptomyces sp. NPDC088725]|uniref:hypothetical protein n=1 Tax=Streptomyces sp. NPDC088725 TaxID=3365873 RepID=UPI003824667A